MSTLVRKPGVFWQFVVGTGRPFYFWQMCFSAGLAFAFAPGLLMVALPEFLADTLSSNGYLHHLSRHYSMPVAAVLICATVVGLAKLKSPGRRLLATMAVTLGALWSCVLWGDAPFSDAKIDPPWASAPSVLAINHLVSLIPPDAVVSAGQNFVPNIDHRAQVYLFPTPFSQSYYGNYHYDGQRLPFASEVTYLLLPSCISCDGNLGSSAQRVFNSISGDFRVDASADGTVLWVKKTNEAKRPS